MNLQLIFFPILSLTVLGIGYLVYRNNRHQLVNKLFVLFTFFVSAWIFSGYLVYGKIAESYGVVWQRLAFTFSSLIAPTLYLLCRIFPDGQSLPRGKLTLSIFSVGILFSLLSIFSPLIVVSVIQSEVFSAKINYGPLYSFFGIYFLATFGLGIAYAVTKLKTSSGRVRLQVQYLFLGAVLPACVAVTTNLIIPLIFRTGAFSPYGRYLSLIFVITTAHAIVRHRLMGIRVIIQKGVVYVCAITVLAAIFIGLGELGSYITPYNVDEIPLAAGMVIAVLVAIFFQPLKKWIEDALNRYVYRQTYDYQRTVREASRRLSTMLDLESLLNYLNEAISTTLKVELVAVYMRDNPGQSFTPRALRQPAGWEQGKTDLVLSAGSPLVTFLERERRTLVADEAPRTQDPSLREAVRELQALGGDIVFPFVHDHMVSGILVVGPKLSGDPYFAEDIDLLSTLASQAGIAIKNAQLYREVTLANEYIENILTTMESGVVAVNSGRQITLCNPAAERLTGKLAGDLRSAPMTRLPAALASQVEATLIDGQPRLQVELILPDAAGRLVPMACSTSPLRDAAGTVHGAVAVFSDLSRLKELEGEKRRAERLAAFGALASGVAHEIKNPLVAIKTFAELFPERYTDAEFRESFSRVAVKEISRIDQLVARLRDLAAPADLGLRPLDIRGPIEETLTLLAGPLQQKRIAVHRLYEEPVPLVDADEPALKQLFLNLFMNSVEAMGEQGELSVRLTRRFRYEVPTLRVEVSDTGSGIPESMLDKIFNPFVTTKPRGSGLGLAICRGIADSHHATIRAENNAGRPGATIVIEFPIAEKVPAMVRR
jgi:PAS domain S-box-containing protein